MASAIPKDIKASLYIDGKPAEASIKAVSQVTRTLERELNSLTIGTEAFNKKLAEVAANKKYLKGLKDEVNGVGGAFSQLKAELGKVGTLAAGYLGFQFITSQFQGIIAGNAKLSDSLADIRRVTGLTEAGVLDLDKSLGKLDTRTSKGGLRDIAVIAGKLGVAKNEILSFVAATDKLTVALGDELGDADAITTQLGKILNVFEGKVNGDNISRLGNAMVGLANDGVASGAFIAQYTQLISGIAKTAGVSLPATLALGAGLEELGGRAESSATATQKLLISITQNKDAYKVAGVAAADFNKMLAEAPEKALLVYAKGLTANKSAFAEVTSGLKDAGEEGARTIELITKLGQNTEFFNAKIEKTGKLYLETNEITDAYNLKNETLAAQVDKLGKDFNALATNTTLVDFLTNLVHWSSSAVKWLKENSVAIGSILKVVVIGTTAWLGYQAALVLTSTWTAIVSGYMATQRTIGLLLALMQATLAGNTLRAAAAQRALGLAMTANPFGIVLALVASLATAYALFSKEITTAAKIQGDFNSIREKGAQNLVSEKADILDLLKALDSENLTREQKLVVIDKLRKIMPEHLKGYTDEAILAGKAKDEVLKYVAALERKTLAEAAQSKIRELQQRNIELTSTGNLSNISTGDELIAGAQNLFGLDGTARLAKKSLSKDQNEYAQNNARIKEIQASYGGVMVEQLVTPESTGTTGGNSGGGKAGKATKGETEAEKKRKKEITEAEKIRDQLAKISQEIYLNTQAEYDKEEYLLNQKYVNMLANTNLSENDIKNIKALNAEEITQLKKKHSDIAEKLAIEEGKKLADQLKKDKQFVYDNTVSAAQQEVDSINEKFDKLIELAKQYNLDVVQLEKDRKRKIDAVWQKDKGLDTDDEKAEKLKKKKEDEAMDWKKAAVETAQNISNAVFDIGKNNREAETNAKLSNLEKQRQAELDDKNLTEDQKKAINDEYNEKVKVEKTKAWEREKKAAITQALINGALAATNIWATTPKVDFGVSTYIMLGVSAAATLASVATIASQKPPEFAEGGMTDENPSGYVSKSTLFNRSASGRPFVAGEKGREWIAPNWMLENPATANIIGTLEVARKEKRLFATGGFSNDQASATNTPATAGYDFYRLEEKLDGFINTQSRFNSLPIVNVYADKEEYERKLQRDRTQQSA